MKDAEEKLNAMRENALPDKPSELIRLALRDMEACEGDAAYNVHFQHWHKPERARRGDPRSELTGACLVCLAGSVMAKTLGAFPHEELVPSHFKEDGELNSPVRGKLMALDCFRAGDVLGGFFELNAFKDGGEAVPGPDGVKRLRSVWEQHVQPSGTFKNNEDVANFLQGMAVFADELDEMGH
ncbi:MAG: hypothetical protein OXC91_02685 [Rhodobacteraceae bacterium]|nr:hypothetical protein [Paracoccaceae bacterium]